MINIEDIKYLRVKEMSKDCYIVSLDSFCYSRALSRSQLQELKESLEEALNVVTIEDQ